MTVVQMYQNIKQMLVIGSAGDKEMIQDAMRGVIQGAVRDLLVVVANEHPLQIYKDMAERCANVAAKVAGIDVERALETAEDMLEVHSL